MIPDGEQSGDPGAAGHESAPEGVGDALKAAVERTLAATAGSATGTRQRAQELVDDVVRRGNAARQRVTRGGEEATMRLADAIGDLRAADGEELSDLSGRIVDLEARLIRVERLLEGRSRARREPEASPSEPHHQADPGE